MRKLFVLPLLIAPLVACEEVGPGILDAIDFPVAALNRVDLVTAPTVDELLGYGCGETLGSLGCSAAGLDVPKKNDLLFSFDVVFDLANPNDDIPIPLVETLLGFTAFDAANLGSVCITFCDPDDDSCEPTANAVGACDPGSAEEVDGPEDLVPTVEQLVDLAASVASGEFDNGAWRVLEPNSSLETHIQFDLGVDPMLDLSDELIQQSLDEALQGRQPSFVIPTTIQGSLFFDIPSLDRYAVGFGPFDDDWDLTEVIR
ncbi:MAG: hypothetical protein H6735_15270 [Alphaproteobacteria bacterium]|nr:hypothetical protein [Alphaproteobacteria bacterium]